MADPPGLEDDLRQGDLLSPMHLPQLKLPLAITRTDQRPVDSDDLVVLKLQPRRYYLVVSQCCAVQSDKIVAIAPVRPTKALAGAELIPYQTERPPLNEGDPPYVYAVHPIVPHEGHPEPPRSGGLLVADFLKIQTFSGDISELQHARIARMTPESRRALRIRIAAFWGRPEDEDENILKDLGIAPGL